MSMALASPFFARGGVGTITPPLQKTACSDLQGLCSKEGLEALSFLSCEGEDKTGRDAGREGKTKDEDGQGGFSSWGSGPRLWSWMAEGSSSRV